MLAQIANPADKQRQADERKTSEPSGTTSATVENVVIEGVRTPFHEEQRIGSYAQPRWTAFRRFPSTRVYVRPEGYFGVEQWFRFEDPQDGETGVTGETEMEFGLPNRFQLDLYLITRREGGTGPTYVDNAVELRYAFADWGVLWGNPTLYAEWVSQDAESNKVELKLLLGDELSPGWHWGSNLVWEYTMGGDKTRELELTLGLSHTLRDDRLSIGLEAKLAQADQAANRGDWERDLRIGPSLQFRPLPQMHIDIAPLFGITHESKRADIFTVVGWEF